MINLLRYWKQEMESKALVLMYHRIAELNCDPWQLAVVPENFKAHIDLLKKKYRILSMDELTEQIRLRKLKSKTVAITFDDGFVDNVKVAAPLLKERRAPASFYITTDLVGTRTFFWWDQLLNIFLERLELPSVCTVTICGEEIKLPTGNHGILSTKMKAQLVQWQAHQSPPNERAVCYFEIWKRLRNMESGYRKSILIQLAEWAGCSVQASEENRIVNPEELQWLAADPIMEVGCHTCSHPALAEHNEPTQRMELSQSKTELERWMGKRVKGLAYPHGSYNSDTLVVASDLHFDYAVTTAGTSARVGIPLLEIPRVQVTNLTAIEFEHELKNWFRA